MAASDTIRPEKPRSLTGRQTRNTAALLAPVTIFYILLLIIPYLILIRLSFFQFSSAQLYIPDFTFENYVSVLTDPYYLRLIANSIGIALVVTIICAFMGFALALLIVRSGPLLKNILLVATLSPLLINLVVRTYAWLVLLGDSGVLNEWLKELGLISAPLAINTSVAGVIIGLVHISLPLMVISIVGVLERMDKSLIEAAESLSAKPGRILARIIIPFSMPGIGSGSLLVFSLAISAFITPVMLGGGRVSTISTLIYEKFTFAVNWPVGSTLVVILLVINFGMIRLHRLIFKQG